MFIYVFFFFFFDLLGNDKECWLFCKESYAEKFKKERTSPILLKRNEKKTTDCILWLIPQILKEKWSYFFEDVSIFVNYIYDMHFNYLTKYSFTIVDNNKCSLMWDFFYIKLYSSYILYHYCWKNTILHEFKYDWFKLFCSIVLRILNKWFK